MAADILSWLTARPIAHRGLHDGNRQCWENTATAFERAIAGGFSIECDVVLTADRVPVVFHDHDLQRLTGRQGRTADTTAEALCALSVGGTKDRPQRLDLALAQIAGRVPVVIELKGDEGFDDGFVTAIAAALDGYGGKAAIMSFDHHLVRRFAADASGVPRGLTAEGEDVAAMEAHFSMLAHGIDFVSYDVAAIDNRFVAFTRRRLGLPLITWTVSDMDAARATWNAGGQITFEGFNPDTVA
ncbi:MAG: glycerophosphodiester phosphodiesterase family protein [Rhizobiaceae bacterium]